MACSTFSFIISNLGEGWGEWEMQIFINIYILHFSKFISFWIAVNDTRVSSALKMRFSLFCVAFNISHFQLKFSVEYIFLSKLVIFFNWVFQFKNVSRFKCYSLKVSKHIWRVELDKAFLKYYLKDLIFFI